MSQNHGWPAGANTNGDHQLGADSSGKRTIRAETKRQKNNHLAKEEENDTAAQPQRHSDSTLSPIMKMSQTKGHERVMLVVVVEGGKAEN